MSPPIRCTITPVAKMNVEDVSWTTTCKATTAGFSLGFKDNVCEDKLSSQSTYKINSGCLYYKEASIAPNPKLLNDFEPSKEQIEKVYGEIMEEVNELRLQSTTKKPFLPLIIKSKATILILPKIKPKMLFFGFFDDIELVDWTTSIFYLQDYGFVRILTTHLFPN
jgi:hypothetical protein